jgi:hypothetical protein
MNMVDELVKLESSKWQHKHRGEEPAWCAGTTWKKVKESLMQSIFTVSWIHRHSHSNRESSGTEKTEREKFTHAFIQVREHMKNVEVDNNGNHHGDEEWTCMDEKLQAFLIRICLLHCENYLAIMFECRMFTGPMHTS